MPGKSEWLEFKRNKATPVEIDEFISALSNSSALCGKTNAYVIWGVGDKDHEVVGTDFIPSLAKPT